MAGFEHLRDEMIDTQILARGLSDQRVARAMRKVPREAFVPEALLDQAYDDCALPIGGGQTISQPYTVAVMVEAARLTPGDRVLEVGTGSGYAAAVLAAIAERVFTIETRAELAEAARTRLAALGIDNVDVRTGDGAAGWPEAAPFEAILVTARVATIPDALMQQVSHGGRLVAPVGREGRERLLKLVRRSDTDYHREDLGRFSFVPLV